jgi:hypothetical protein
MVEEGLKLKSPIFFLEEDVAYSWASIWMHISWLSGCLGPPFGPSNKTTALLQCHPDFLSRQEGAWKRSPTWQL